MAEKVDPAFREEFGMSLEQALVNAKDWRNQTGEETFVFFRSNDPDLGKLYDWTTETGLATDDLWVKPDRIIWSSADGDYQP